MNRRRIAVLFGIATVVVTALEYGPGWLFDQWLGRGGSGFPGWAPTFGTTGETLTVYFYVMGIGLPALKIVLGIGLGYYLSQELNLSNEYHQYTRAVLIGSTIGALLVWPLELHMRNLESYDGISGIDVLASSVEMFLVVPAFITVAAFAGAALSHFQSTGNGTTSITGETDTPSSSQGEPTSEISDSGTQSQ